MTTTFDFLSYKEPFEINDHRIGVIFRTKLSFKKQNFIISEAHWRSSRKDDATSIYANDSCDLTDIFLCDEEFNNSWSEVISGAKSTEESLILLVDYFNFLGEQDTKK